MFDNSQKYSNRKFYQLFFTPFVKQSRIQISCSFHVWFQCFSSAVILPAALHKEGHFFALFQMWYSEIPWHQAFGQFCHCSRKAQWPAYLFLKLNRSACQNPSFLLNSNAFLSCQGPFKDTVSPSGSSFLPLLQDLWSMPITDVFQPLSFLDKRTSRTQ